MIATGTPEGVGSSRKPPRFMAAGDALEVDIPGVGTLVNRVTDEPARHIKNKETRMADALLYLTERDVVSVLDMRRAIDALHGMLVAQGRDEARNLPKALATWGDGSSMHALGSVQTGEGGYAGFKTWVHTGRRRLGVQPVRRPDRIPARGDRGARAGHAAHRRDQRRGHAPWRRRTPAAPR